MTWNESYRLQLWLRSLVFLPHKVKTEEKTFKVKVFNKQFNDQDTFEGITEYIQLD